MPWDRRQPTDPKYRTAEHRRERARWVREMQTQGYLLCQQPVCVEPSRVITPNTRWHAGHADDGVNYIGPVHATCNRQDGAKRGNERSRGVDRRWKL